MVIVMCPQHVVN